MSQTDNGHGPHATAAEAKSKVRRRRRHRRQRLLRGRHALVGALVALGAFPGVAAAHGPVDPIATSYLAKLSGVPAGLDAKVVDGDLRLWLRVAPRVTAVVRDYRGGAYLRFSRSGVAVNVNSAMYYLNQTPAESPPARVSPAVPARWRQVSSGHEYSWHDGRLHALASVALAPGTTYVGRWSIPVVIGGQLSSIFGGVFYAPDPSIVWFWPIVVLLACTLAAWRVRRPALDARVAPVLAVAALVAIATAGAGRELHGRPTVSVFQLITLAIIFAFVAWGLRRVLLQRLGWFSFFAISIVAIWEGIQLLPTLLHGFVLAAVPADLTRVAAILCLGCGAGLLLFVFRLADQQGLEASDGDQLSDQLSDQYDFENVG
jgi:hypothetical protein